jgi:methylglutaconyl-CoA hydratase
LVFTGSVVNGRQAADLGLVNHAVETDPMDKALDLARSILPNGPVALRMAKLAMSNGLNKDLYCFFFSK